MLRDARARKLESEKIDIQTALRATSSKIEKTHEKIKKVAVQLKKAKADQRAPKTRATNAPVKELMAASRAVRVELSTLKAESKTLKLDLRIKQQQIKDHYIFKRNEYSKGQLKRDYVNRLKEIDAESEQEEGYPSEERDYEEITSKAKVFCVSSKRYQQILSDQGRYKLKDNKELTGIPELQEFCVLVTEEPRRKLALNYLNNLSMLMSSLSLWACAKRNESLTIEEDDIKQLKKALTNLADYQSRRFKNLIEKKIFKKFSKSHSSHLNSS